MNHVLLKTAALSALTLTLAACQTTAPAPVAATPQQQLFSSISPSKYDGTLAAKSRSAEDPTCLQFYANATGYMTRNQVSGGTGGAIFKTIALGMLSGAASGGVGSLGIGSAFLETAIAGTANQVVFQGGQKVLDSRAEPEPKNPMTDVAASAETLGCPPLTKASMKASKKAAKALRKAKKSDEG